MMNFRDLVRFSVELAIPEKAIERFRSDTSPRHIRANKIANYTHRDVPLSSRQIIEAIDKERFGGLSFGSETIERRLREEGRKMVEARQLAALRVEPFPIYPTRVRQGKTTDEAGSVDEFSRQPQLREGVVRAEHKPRSSRGFVERRAARR